MDTLWKTVLWQQFGAALDMFADVLRTCPEDLWQERLWNDPEMPAGYSEFWYVAYHTLFWLDLYLSGSADGFIPPLPFDLAELDPQGLLPNRVFTRAELLGYLAQVRQKCQVTIETLTDERAARVCRFMWGETAFAGLLLDNMRHVQEHGAQLRLFLGQQAGSNPRWISKVG